jgi:hypothetical protein
LDGELEKEPRYEVKKSLFILVLMMIGCGHDHWYAAPITGPDGKDNWVAIECIDKLDCRVLESRCCPLGYDVVETNEADGQDTITAGNALVVKTGKNRTKRIELLVRCHTSRDRDDEVIDPFKQ